MIYRDIPGVPAFHCSEYRAKATRYCLCIPIINEGRRIWTELKRARDCGVHNITDIILCDGGSTDGSVAASALRPLGVNTLLVKDDIGRQGAQLRMGLWWALRRGYEGVVTIDGNNKDSIESVPDFVARLDQGYDFIQGSRFIRGGRAAHTPWLRYLAVRLIHAPLISCAAGAWFTDTTNAFRGYSRRYLEHAAVQPFRDVFMRYELLAYLSVRAAQLGLKVGETPVERIYPEFGRTPTKISLIQGNKDLLATLLKTVCGRYHPS